uniref:Cytochrome b6-f complex subunit 7 n=1 Tax=Gracilaria caudata TaxID=2572395 RepID=A0A345U6P8_9FLOR|nr:cytochrome b6-f complex subunit 7 [Gracilaria caudata]YP_010196178.1 cytochrome b6-f complex subunit 7 [Gracilaria caudata]YP_010199214.1 cytochrome b6-f complex subunit 7 [Crassiphycus usneoides]AXI96134.1 cytochrome b6-f complex subunit 7 [Gracilaria caudata]UAD83575.1 cytochrome b6-f complex subunit 7 [Gracilaria caudata]UAD88663.1 cytochrome b6-f complex subunit 7 [Crassiphycus usneoides]
MGGEILISGTVSFILILLGLVLGFILLKVQGE